MANKYFSRKIMSSIFMRKGGEGLYTKGGSNLYQLNTDALESFIEEADVSIDDVVIACIKKEPNINLILITQRYLVVKKDKILKIDLADIQDARIVLDMNVKTGGSNSLKEIDIYFSNFRERIKVEDGQPYFGILNLLKSIASKNED